MQRFGGLAFKAFQEANKDKAAVSWLPATPCHRIAVDLCRSEVVWKRPAGRRRVQGFLLDFQMQLLKPPPPSAALPQIYREVGVVDPTSTLNHDQFVSLIKAIDAGLRALPATAQVC